MAAVEEGGNGKPGAEKLIEHLDAAEIMRLLPDFQWAARKISTMSYIEVQHTSELMLPVVDTLEFRKWVTGWTKGIVITDAYMKSQGNKAGVPLEVTLASALSNGIYVGWMAVLKAPKIIT